MGKTLSINFQVSKYTGSSTQVLIRVCDQAFNKFQNQQFLKFYVLKSIKDAETCDVHFEIARLF